MIKSTLICSLAAWWLQTVSGYTEYSSRFKVVEQSMTWSAANDYCADTLGTQLATVTSDDDADTLMRIAHGDQYEHSVGTIWIGLSSEAAAEEWSWASDYECDGDCASSWWFVAGGNDQCAAACSSHEMCPQACTSSKYFVCDAVDPLTMEVGPVAQDCFSKAETNGWYGDSCSLQVPYGETGIYVPYSPSECAQACLDYGEDCYGYELYYMDRCYIFTSTGCALSENSVCYKFDRTSSDCLDAAPEPTGCDVDTYSQHCDVWDGTCDSLPNGLPTGSCCTEESPCSEGEGDCDNDNDCAGPLMCGTDNCAYPFPGTHDCCYSPDADEEYHRVVQGNLNSNHFTAGSPDWFCADSNDHQTPTDWQSTRSKVDVKNKIAVRCCHDDEGGWSPKNTDAFPMDNDCYAGDDYDYNDGATFEQAESFCAARGDGWRLCSYAEVDERISKGTGCYYDHVYHWVSDTCQQGEQSSNALANARAETGSMTAEEAASNGSGAANGSETLSTIAIIIGAAVGAVLIVAVAAMVFLKRRKADVHFGADGAEPAADVSSSDIAVKIETGKVTAESVDIGDEQVVTTDMPSCRQ